jgi:hypothetical protein
VDADVCRCMQMYSQHSVHTRVLPFATLKVLPSLQNCSVHNTRSAIGTCKVILFTGLCFYFICSHFSYFRKKILNTVQPRFTNLIHSWRSFINRNVRKPKILWSHGVLFNNIFKKPQNTMKFKRRHGELEQGCVVSESYTATDALPPILPAYHQLLLPACVFVTRDTVHHPRLFSRKICSWWEAFVNRFVRDERRSWTDLFVMRGVREPRFHCI